MSVFKKWGRGPGDRIVHLWVQNGEHGWQFYRACNPTGQWWYMRRIDGDADGRRCEKCQRKAGQ